jgi:hypothetical protein
LAWPADPNNPAIDENVVLADTGRLHIVAASQAAPTTFAANAARMLAAVWFLIKPS